MARLAVLGHPVAHSRSPAIHNAALAELGLAPQWSYEAIDVAPEEFESLVAELPARGFVGANVTVPHKLAALAVADSASAAAVAIGAANTLSFGPAGIAAENTDAEGMIAAIGAPLEGSRALVLGAGGSARAAIWALREGGAEVSVWNRTAVRATQVAEEFGVAGVAGDPAGLSIDGFELLVNATTIGLQRGGGAPPSSEELKQLPFDADSISARQTLLDLVYGSHETALSRHARQRGARVIDGLEVLVWQGAASLRIWTGVDPPLETMRRAAEELQSDG